MGAEISRKPMSLASALRKISAAAEHIVNPPAERNPASAHLFIVNPIKKMTEKTSALMATHPDIASRIARLKDMSA